MARPKGSSSSNDSGKKVRTLDSFNGVKVSSVNRSAAALAVLNSEIANTRARPRRNASQRASRSLAEMIDPHVGSIDDDEDFEPAKELGDGEGAEVEEEYEEDRDDMEEEELDNAIEKPSVRTKRNKSISVAAGVPKPKPTGAKRGRKPKKAASIDEEIKALTPTSKLDNKHRIIRGLKDLTSARDKIERIYGLNEQKLVGLAKVKEGFEAGPFDFNLQTIQEDSKYFVDSSPPWSKEDAARTIPLKSAKFDLMEESDLAGLFPVRQSELRLTVGDLDTTIGSGQKLEFPVLPCGKRKGFIYSTGALVTDLAWLPRDSNGELFLAVSMSKYIDDPADPHLRLFSKEEHISCITIFRLNPNTLSFEKYQTIIHQFGETWGLKWHGTYQGHEYLGLLAMCCQDGTVKFIKVEFVQKYEIMMLQEASLEVFIPQELISCFDFTSSSSIICGFQNGYVAEFELGSSLPSFYYKIHDSYVISIVTAYSHYEDTVINTISVDGFTCAFNPKSIRTTKSIVGRARGGNNTPAVYCPQLYCVAYSDGVNSVKAYPPRAVFATHQICMHDNTVSSLAASKLHPYLLSGSADGALMINNMARRFLTGIKNNTTVYKYLKLWQWDYSLKEDKYRLDPNYEVYNFSVNEVSKAKVDPHGINVSSVKWNETSKFGKFFAFVNNAGLIVVEELGSQ
ncbi:LAQU0S04e01156g1_1 [Lachancea quebecensis]|uniref:LAQU0S04e01156g1_1 n=1 Tax=Lachancea quebecensis TaxID=1654605 RepID=A0A0N7MLB3_9SACH|nr:LAQU0S04e01156g1_1 [Lachancea quebecensis]